VEIEVAALILLSQQPTAPIGRTVKTLVGLSHVLHLNQG